MSDFADRDGIAIVAIGCRFPGSVNTPGQFWKLLCDGTDAITEIPPRRFEVSELFDPDPSRPGMLYSRWGGFADNIDAFDAEFFAISPREAARVDPQQRLLLEVVWEALEDGGQPADRLAGSRTGVFIGISTHDYHDLQVNHRHLLDAHSSTGTALSIAANRISYVYDLRGPSMVVDTACSSSMTAVHLACRSLRSRECDLAIAGGVNAVLTPDVAIGFCRASMLSPDGRCKAFDAGANGFVRGEGAGVVVLKPLARAIADGDRIYAVVRGTAVDQDGRTVGITVPSATAQEALIREALRDAGVEPSAVQYVEAHGTGTRVGDPIEASAIGRVFAGGRNPSSPCLIGSVKTNIGHLEAAAGIAGLIKTALALKHRAIPPSLHFHAANPSIPLDDLRLQVATALLPWPKNGARATACVNSFGFGGANAHVVLEEPPPKNGASAVEQQRSVHILPISARHPGALRELVRRYREAITGDGAPVLADLCFSAAVRRTHHPYRAALVGATREELIEQIDAFLARDDSDLPPAGRGARSGEPKLAFVFSGMGPQWWGMGRQLLDAEPLFRDVIEECDRLFRDIGTWPLLEALRADQKVSRVHEAELAPAANLAIQMGLVQLWRSWGIVPDAIVGHSAGEIGAACAAGALSLEDALLVAFHRGRLQCRAKGSGTMLSAGISENAATQLIAGLGNQVSIAAVNSPTSITLSGHRQTLERIAAELTRQQRFNRFLPVDVAYHAPPMDALRDELLKSLAPVDSRPPAVPLISTVSGTRVEGRYDPEHWFANLREPVRFADAIDRLIADDYGLFLEISPHPVLAASISECLSSRARGGRVLPSLRRKEEERRVMLRSLAEIYNRGRRVNWSGVCGTGTFVSMPGYPWQRERFWFEGEQAAPHRPPGVHSGHPLLGCRLRSVRRSWEVDLDQAQLGYLDDHIVQGSPVFPGAAYAEMALAAAAEITPDGVPVVEELTFRKVLFLTHRKGTLLQFLLDAHGTSFEVHSGTQGDGVEWTLNASGKLGTRSSDTVRPAVSLAAIRERLANEVPVSEVYESLARRGLAYRGAFRTIQSLWRGDGEAIARLAWPPDVEAGTGSYRVHPALLDGSMQALLAAAESANGPGRHAPGLYLPVFVRRLTLFRSPGSRCWGHVAVTRVNADSIEGNIAIFDDEGEVALTIEGLQCKALEDGARSRPAGLDDLFHHLGWVPKPLEVRQAREARPIRTAAELGERLQPVADRLACERGWAERLRRVEPLADAIVARFTRAALATLGWDPGEPVPADVELFGDRLGVAPRHRRFFGRLIEIVRGFRVADEKCGSPATERLAAEKVCAAVLTEFPEYGPVIDLLRRCGERLDAILKDDLDAREVLFGPDAVSSWTRFFAELPFYEFYNTLVADTIATAVEEVPAGTRLRVLEIGAGTGATTRPVLARLEARNVEYCFTDVSTFFLAQARDRFGDQSFVRVASLDIEADPIAQLGSEPFDVILAANVLHATADLRTALRHIQQLLAPGGLLVLLEVGRKMALLDLIFGVTEGWWRFTDLDVRPEYALLGPRRWQEVLGEAGFEGAIGVSEPHGDVGSLQTVMLATLPAGAAGQSGDRRTASPKDWLVFLDSLGVGERIASSLRSRGDRCVAVHRSDSYVRRDLETFGMSPDRPEHVARIVGELAPAGFCFHGLIHAWSLDTHCSPALSASQVIDASQANCGSVISVVQGFEQSGRTLPPLWLLTSDAQSVEPGRDGANLVQAPLWGLARVLASELPSVRCRLVDLGADRDESEIHALLDELEADDFEEEVAFRASRRYVTRLRRRGRRETTQAHQKRELSPERQAFRLEIETTGALETLTLRETLSTAPAPGEVLIRVLASGLNFRDVMLALGMLPPIAIPGSAGKTILGFECAGIVVACGEGVKDFRPGDEVMAIGMGTFGSQVVTREEMTAHKPGHLTFDEAATIPLVFITAHYGLHHLARLSAGERVLIHAATGGVGLAAIQLARRAGAEIFATAGSHEKRDYLKAMGVMHVMDSRSVAFADEVMAATGGEGVDVVLNSLTGEAISKGLSILRPYGRFVEIGKRDIYADTPIGLLPFDKNLSFSSIALDRMFLERPAFVGSMLREIAELTADKTLAPLPHTDFDLAEAERALRFLAQAKHIGKLVLTVREPAYAVAPCLERPFCRPDATYVISGGLGGFGLLIGRWMVNRGARHIVLMSRSGAPTAENQAAFKALHESPAQIVNFQGDVSDEADVSRMFDGIRATMPPLRGIVHAAMVLDDAMLAQVSAEQLRAVLSPKVGGAWNLHRLTEADDLDFFVMFSSFASVLGPRGQGSYAAANHFLDALAPYRRSLGLPALTINWGGLGEVGYLSRHDEVAQHLHRHGMKTFTPDEATASLEEALRMGFSQIMVVRLDWPRWSAMDPSSAIVKKARRLADFVSGEQASSRDESAERGSLLFLLSGAAPGQRQALLQGHVLERVARVLGTSPQKVDPATPLTDMGVDSLMAVELQTVLQRDCGVQLPLAAILDNISAAQLTAKLFERLTFDAAEPAPVAEGAVPAPASPDAAPGDAAAEAPLGQPTDLATEARDKARVNDPITPIDERSMAVPADAAVPALEHPGDRRMLVETVPARPASAPPPAGPDYRSIDYSRWTSLQRFAQDSLSASSGWLHT